MLDGTRQQLVLPEALPVPYIDPRDLPYFDDLWRAFDHAKKALAATFPSGSCDVTSYIAAQRTMLGVAKGRCKFKPDIRRFGAGDWTLHYANIDLERGLFVDLTLWQFDWNQMGQDFSTLRERGILPPAELMHFVQAGIPQIAVLPLAIARQFFIVDNLIDSGLIPRT